MALSVKVINTQSEKATGNKAYTGIGFQPIALFFFGSHVAATGSTTNAEIMHGMATSSTARAVVVGQSFNGNNPSTSGRRWDNTKCVGIVDNNTNYVAAADLVTLDSDGFTLNWTTADAVTNWLFSVLCIGGTDVTNANVLQFQGATSTGSQAVTGMGFKPDAIIVMGGNSATAPPNAAGVWLTTFSMATGSANRGSTSFRDNNVSTTVTEKTQSAAKIYLGSNGSGALSRTADLTSLDSDGFTLNWTAVSGAVYCWALGLKGGQYTVGSFNQATSNGTQSVSGLAFQPTGLLLESWNSATSSSVLSTAQWSYGAASSTSARASLWSGSLNGHTGSATDTNYDTANLLKMYTPTGTGSPTALTAADFSSFDATGFTINNSATDGTAREILYLAMGSNASSYAPTHMMLGMGI